MSMKKLYLEIAQKDIEKLNSFVKKGYEETGEFKDVVLSAYNSLGILYQIMQEEK